jgi:outer membrane protein OmpA-like peptidoglycan-associated protein
VGEAFERPGAVAGGLIGDTLLIARNERLLRLDRVVTREVPSSAVYFDTADDRFSDALTPFLEDIASLMRGDRSTTLRIEGHADQRG